MLFVVNPVCADDSPIHYMTCPGLSMYHFDVCTTGFSITTNRLLKNHFGPTENVKFIHNLKKIAALKTLSGRLVKHFSLLG